MRGVRGGRKVTTEETRNCSQKMMAKLMVGHEIVLNDLRGRGAGAVPISADAVLRLDEVRALDDLGNVALNGVSLDIRGGEILGIAGGAGNGQKELSQVMTGMRPVTSGRIEVGGASFTAADAEQFAAFGVGHIPEDRLHSGLAPALSVTDNAVMREYKKAPVSIGNWFRPRAATALAETIATAASVAVPDFAMPVRNLSGGNQQRLVARRGMRIAGKVLVAAYPSRHLDVGAINTMMRYFVELRDAGVGVILISEELEELLNLSDRIAVMFHGEIMGLVETASTGIEQIGMLMGGQRAAAPRLEPASI